MSNTPAKPKCPDKGCEHLVTEHDSRMGCRAFKVGQKTGMPCRCGCNRTF